MSLHKEINFESEICEYLATNGWQYAESDAAKYDRARALFPEDVLTWVQETQPQAWDAVVKNHGSNAADTLLTRSVGATHASAISTHTCHSHRPAGRQPENSLPRRLARSAFPLAK